jgi:hypothetical protein
MARKPLSHISLGTHEFSSDVTQKIYVTRDMTSQNKLKFKYACVTVVGDPSTIFPLAEDFAVPPTTDLLDIKIKKTCFVQMTLLRTNLDWHWRTQDAITTAISQRTYYKQLQYLVGEDWVEDPGDGARCQTIRFGAYKRAGDEGPRDPFNMNVILEWDSNDVLPITIDPDIQNPKV